MADTNAILTSDKSSAPTVALSLLCALVAVELAAGVRGLWSTGVPLFTLPAAAAPTAAPGPAPVATARLAPGSASSLTPIVIPPIPKFTNPIPVAGSPALALPPVFSQPPSAPARSLPPAAPRTVAPMPKSMLPPSTQASSSVVHRSASPPVPEAPKAATPPQEAPVSTGNPQADDLIDVALQSRDLGDNEGALEALNRADLLVPDNPRIMREKVLTLQRLGRPAEAAVPGSAAGQPPAGANRSEPQGAEPPSAFPGASSTSPARAPVQAPSASASPAERLNQSFGSHSGAAAASPLVAAVPPPATINGALSLGEIQLQRDATVTKGERYYLKVPLIPAQGEVIDPNQMALDVFFYDKVNNERVELTMADKPKFAYDTTGDFKNGREVLSVLYNLPEFSAREIAEHGRHTFYGYVVKLYYKNRLVGAVSNRPDLSTAGDAVPSK